MSGAKRLSQLIYCRGLYRPHQRHRIARYGHIALVIAAFLYWVNCDNIFSSDEIGVDTRTITGTVKLSQESDVSNIYVYLDNLNLGVFTDVNGNFNLTLPPDLSAAGGAVSGVFNLYFYLATFNISSVKVAIQNGLFIFDQENLDKNGRVNPTPMLSKALIIETSVAGGYRGIPHAYSAKIKITAAGNQYPVDLPNASQEIIGGALIHHLDTDSVYTQIMYTAGYTQIYHFTAYQSGRDFFLIFDSEDLHLPPGNYRVIPHVLPDYNDMAKKIAESMGIDPVVLGADYLKWPMRFSGGEITITGTQPPPE